MKNTVNDNMAVYLSYRMFGKKNDVAEVMLEEVEAGQPWGFIFGMEPQFPALEEELRGKEEGHQFNIHISQEDAYGPYDENLVIDIDKETFMVDGVFDSEKVLPGNHLTFMTQDGAEISGKVLVVGLEKVKVDFNNPLAGYDLRFEGRVEKIRPLSEEEREHGHLHDPGNFPHHS